MLNIIRKLFSTPYFFYYTNLISKHLGTTIFCLLFILVYGALIAAPDDYQQQAAFRIIYLHVPLAIYSIFIFIIMGMLAASLLLWRNYLLDILCQASAKVGVLYTSLALLTGSMWGKQMWGSYWVWDARLVSELILLFLYFGYLGIRNSINNVYVARKLSSIFLLLGLVDIPIIHFSVKWWNTLHQDATISKLSRPSIAFEMLWPLLLAMLIFLLYYIMLVMIDAQRQIVENNSEKKWIKQYY